MRHTERREVMRASFDYDITFTCDKCGATFTEDEFATNELTVALDPDECVSYAHRRDYCAHCANLIWPAICKLIGADPDSEERTGFE